MSAAFHLKSLLRLKPISFGHSVAWSHSYRYCIDQVRKYDYENFLAILLIPNEQVKRAAFAVRALNVELSQIPDLTKNQQISQMRYLFWSEILDDVFGKRSSESHYVNQPVAKELYKVTGVTGKKLSKRNLKRLIDARNSPNSRSSFPFTTVNQLEEYASSTVCPVYLFLIEVALNNITKQSTDTRSEGDHSIQLKLDHLASHVGSAQALANILRGIAHNARHGNRCYIPTELLVEHGATHEDFLRGLGDRKQVKDVIFAVASLVHQHVETANGIVDDNRKQIKPFMPIFLPLISIETYLNRLRHCDFNVFAGPLNRRDGTLPLKLWWKSIKLKFWPL
ncbi:NADH dehydrogenase (ubiquinone) complex I, assembly factor 6 -like protein [Halotydeus destructor]|nr:NADH dehydrogenase (ubiquinone) complex I, assembly factor 6 -like protein [Halotydeus destructor]